MKIAFFEISDWEANYIREKLTGQELYFFAGPLKKGDTLDMEYDVVSTFVGSVIPKEFFSGPLPKMIATRSTGFDHIDLREAREKKILVSNVPTYGENTVAEFTFALLLTLSRKVYQSVKRVREQGWFSFDGLRGFDLKDKILGVVGTGHIGAYVIKIARGFGMNVIAYDPFPNEKLSSEYNFEYVQFEDLLKRSDVITLHVPYLPSTHHMLNQQTMQHIKPGSVLINTSRGGLVETQALVEALRSGILAGAALDVLEEEGFIKDEVVMLTHGHPNSEQLKTVLADHELMYMDNVIITPHNAFQTTEAMRRILDMTLENIDAFIKGNPKNLVK